MKRNLALFVFVFFSCLAYGQEELRTLMSNNMEKYNLVFPKGFLHLTLNQQKFLPGDSIFFSAYYMPFTKNTEVEKRKIAALEVRDSENKMVVMENLLFKSGRLSSGFRLPSHLREGVYSLLAYTSEIKDYAPQLEFRTPIIIAGKTELSIQNDEPTFYPEGGLFVEGIANRVLINFQDSRIQSAQLVRNNNDIQTIDIVKGFGLLTMIPNPGDNFQIKFSSNGLNKSVPLTQALPSGYSLQADVDNEYLKVKVNGSKVSEKDLLLTLINRQGVLSVSKIRLDENNSFETTFLKTTLSHENFLEIVLTNDKKQLLGQRVVSFSLPHKARVEITGNNGTYQLREKIKLKINVLDESNNPVEADLSIAINQQKLGNEMGFYRSNDKELIGPCIPDNLDLSEYNRLLMSQKYAWFNWDYVSNGPPERKLENEKIALSGSAYNLTEQPLPDSTKLFFLLKNNIVGYETYVSKGHFRLPFIFDFYGRDEVFISAKIKGIDFHDYRIQFDSTFTNNVDPLTYKAEHFETIDGFHQYRTKKSFVDESFDYFEKESHSTSTNYNRLLEDEFQEADQVFDPKKYLLFPTMRDLIKEVLTGVDYRKVRGKDNIHVYTDSKIQDFENGPLYVIDGQLTKNPINFLSLNPEDLVEIRIVRSAQKLQRLSSLSANGVIFVTTLSKKKLVINNSFQIAGFLPTVSLSGKKIISNARTPDLRSSLLWNPKIASNEVELFSSDDVGRFVLKVNGFTFDGNLIHHDELLEVRFESTKNQK